MVNSLPSVIPIVEPVAGSAFDNHLVRVPVRRFSSTRYSRAVATEIVIRGAQLVDADRLFALVQQFATSYQPRRAAFDDALPRLLASATADCVSFNRSLS